PIEQQADVNVFSQFDTQPDDFLVDKTPELSRIAGDDPVQLKEKINSSNMYSDLSGLSFDKTFDLYEDLPDIKPAFFDINAFMDSSLQGVDNNVAVQQKEGVNSFIWEIARPFVSQGYTAASAANRGMAQFSEHLNNAAQFIEDIGIGEKGDIFELAAKQYEENAEFWTKRAEEVGVNVIDELVGEAIGGAIPGVTQFTLDVASGLTLPFAAGAGAEKKEGAGPALVSGLTEAAKVGVLH
ncbi:unnamed protein product, partial [marine sediment metagenome]